MTQTIVPPKVPKDLLIRLSKLRVENPTLVDSSLDQLVRLYFPIPVGPAEADAIKVAKETFLALVDGVAAKSADAVRDARAIEFSTALNEMNTVELFIKGKGGKYEAIGPLFSWLGNKLIPIFEENMTPTISQDKAEDGTISYKFAVTALRQRGRVAGGGGRFRPDITTLLDGTVVVGPATNILRSEQYKNTKAGKDWAMVENGTAKGMRSAIFLGLANDAQNITGAELPIFRVWVVNTDDDGNIILDANGMPTATELDASGSQYVESLADSKAKFANPTLKDIRTKVPQPKWTAEVLNATRKKWSEQHPGQPVPGAPIVAGPVLVAQAPVVAGPVPIHGPVPIATQPNVAPVAAVAARTAQKVAVKRKPSNPTPVIAPNSDLPF